MDKIINLNDHRKKIEKDKAEAFNKVLYKAAGEIIDEHIRKTEAKQLRKITKIKKEIKKLLNAEIKEKEKRDYLNRILVGGLRFMLFEQEKMQGSLEHEVEKLKQFKLYTNNISDFPSQ